MKIAGDDSACARNLGTDGQALQLRYSYDEVFFEQHAALVTSLTAHLPEGVTVQS